MNVSNTAAMNDSLTQVYKNINTVEKKARNLSFKQVDAKTRLMEGLPLYNEALRQCESTLNSAPADDREGLKSDYMTLIEKDCSAYTSVLKDKADAASNLLIQAQKNEEMYNEQEHKKLNQLDTNACYVEYETCMKTQCGENFTNCLESAKQEANLKKCQAINYGKCEDNKSVVILDLKKAIKKALAKEAVPLGKLSMENACSRSNMRRIIVLYFPPVEKLRKKHSTLVTLSVVTIPMAISRIWLLVVTKLATLWDQMASKTKLVIIVRPDPSVCSAQSVLVAV